MSVEAPTAPPPSAEAGLDTSAAPEPKTDKADDERLRIVVAGLDQNIDAFAREAAHEELSENPKGPRWKRMVTSVWNNLSHEYQVVRATQRKREEIQESGNLLHHHGKSDKQWREATADRYASEYGEQLTREGETFHRLSEAEAATDERAQRIRTDVLDMVRGVANGDIIDEESLEEQMARTTQEWKKDGVGEDFVGEGKFWAHNVLPMGMQVRAALDSMDGLSDVDRAARLEEILAKAEVITGEAKVGSTVELQSTVSERLAAKLHNVPFLNESRLGKVVAAVTNETTVAAMLSVATYGAKRTLSAAATAALIPGLGGGIVAGLRERRRLKDERALEARRLDMGMAAGERPDDSGLSRTRRILKKLGGIGIGEQERRADIDETLYEARPVEELIDGLGHFYDDSGGLTITDRAGLEDAMLNLTEAKARMGIDAKGKRLISFGNINPEEREHRRFDLELGVAKLEADMKKLFGNPVAVGMLGIKPDETYEQWEAIDEGIMTGMLEGEMSAKDRLFAKLVIKRGLQRGTVGTIIGATLGLGAHEFEAMFSGGGGATTSADGTNHYDMQNAAYETPANPSPPSVPDTIGGGGAPTVPDQIGTPSVPAHIGGTAPSVPGSIGGTPGVPGHIGGAPTVPDHIGTGPQVPDHIGNGAPSVPEHIGGTGGETSTLSDTSHMTLPEGYSAQVNGSELTITGPHGDTYSNLQLNQDGSLSTSAQETLRLHGFNISDHAEVVQGAPEVSHPTVSATEFVQNHKTGMKLIQRQGWMDQNSPNTPILNALGLQNHVDSHGNIIIDVRDMTSTGSYHGANSVDWHEVARSGHLKVDLSVSRGSQAHVFEVQFRPDGTAMIEKGSPEAALFDSHGNLQGGFEEATVSEGQAANGAENVVVLATVVGENKGSFTDTLTSPTLQTTHDYTVTTPQSSGATVGIQPSAFTQAPSYVAPPIIPLLGRRRLGKAAPATAPSATSTSSPGASTPGPAAGGLPGSGGAPSGPGTAGASAASDTDASASPDLGGPDTHSAEAGDTDTDTSTSPGSSGPDVAGAEAAGASTESTTPSDDGSSAESKAPDPAEEEKKFTDDLDAETLSTPTGYDFKRWSDLGARERKLAVRFVNRAIGELGGDDRAAVVARALELAEEELKGVSAGVAKLYRESLGVLGRMRDRVEADSAKSGNADTETGKSLFEDLDAETGSFPFSVRASYSPATQRLVARIYQEAKSQVVEERRLRKVTRPEPSPGDPEYGAFMKRVFRKATRLTHVDRYGDLSQGQQALLGDAQKIINEAKTPFN